MRSSRPSQPCGLGWRLNADVIRREAVVSKQPALRPHYLDASALVKLVVDEEYSTRVRGYMFSEGQSWRVCTSYCFAEAFGALKLRNRRGELSDNGYIVGSRKLVRLVREELVRILEGEISSLTAFAEAERMVSAYAIDFLDAFQLISVKNSWPQLAPPSQPLLVTADGDLAKAAEREGIKCWYCRETHEPRC